LLHAHVAGVLNGAAVPDQAEVQDLAAVQDQDELLERSPSRSTQQKKEDCCQRLLIRSLPQSQAGNV